MMKSIMKRNLDAIKSISAVFEKALHDDIVWHDALDIFNCNCDSLLVDTSYLAGYQQFLKVHYDIIGNTLADLLIGAVTIPDPETFLNWISECLLDLNPEYEPDLKGPPIACQGVFDDIIQILSKADNRFFRVRYICNIWKCNQGLVLLDAFYECAKVLIVEDMAL